MIYAYFNGLKIEPKPGLVGYCPECNEEVIAKCGQINIWHWAHRSNSNCPMSDGETEWHLSWKKKFFPEDVEVKLGNRRADIYFDNKILEIQNSSITPEETKQRHIDYFPYGSIYWIFNGYDFADNFNHRLTKKRTGEFFYWKWPRKSILSSVGRKFIDFHNGDLFEIIKVYTDNKGFGKIISINEFMLDIMGMPTKQNESLFREQMGYAKLP